MKLSFLTSVAVATVAAVVMTGCASAPKNQVPYATHGAGDIALSRTTALDQTSHMVQHLDDKKHVLYFQNFGGGGAAVGVLLGPLGVAANIKAIDSNTSKNVEVLRGKVQADPLLAFKSAASRTNVVVQDESNGSTVRATPYVYVVKMQEEPQALAVAAALIIESPSNKPSKRKNAAPEPQWRNKYMYQLAGSYTVASLAAMDEAAQQELEMELESGYASILTMLQRDTAEQATREKQVKFRSPFLMPRFDFELIGNLVKDEGEIVWIRNPTGVYGLQRTSYKPVQQARR